MVTRDIQRHRTAITHHRLGAAALACAIALTLLMPVMPSAWSGTASRPAMTSLSAVLTRDARAPMMTRAMRVSETGCCA
jgi:hypothetical protein